MRRKLAGKEIVRIVEAKDWTEHTICLGGLNFLQQALEPTKGRGVSANPEELYAPERAHVALALAVPDMLQNGSKWSNTYQYLSLCCIMTTSER